MSIIFDTSIIIEIRNRNPNVLNKLGEIKKLYPSSPKISFMSYFEFMYGLRNKSEKNKETELDFLNKFEVIQTTKSTADFMVLLKEKYNLPFPDLMIASHTNEHDGVLITKDRDFEQIKEINKIIL